MDNNCTIPITTPQGISEITITLPMAVLDCLAGTTSGRSNFWFFKLLIDRMQVMDTIVTRRGISYQVKAGQVDVPQSVLAQELGVNRKYIKKVMDALEQGGAIRIYCDRLSCLVDMACVYGWKTDSMRGIKNPRCIYNNTPQEEGRAPLEITISHVGTKSVEFSSDGAGTSETAVSGEYLLSEQSRMSSEEPEKTVTQPQKA